MEKLTNSQILERFSPYYQNAIAAAIQVVDALLAAVEKVGGTVQVWPLGYGHDWSEEPYDPKTAIFQCGDGAWVRVYGADGIYLGSALLIPINGVDTLSDYTLNIEDFLRENGVLQIFD